MLEKCMVVRATRFVVPSVVGDLPYTNEEMIKVEGFGREQYDEKQNKCKMEKAGSYHCNELMPADGTDANKGICSRQF